MVRIFGGKRVKFQISELHTDAHTHTHARERERERERNALLANGDITSRVDYCNSVVTFALKKVIDKLQWFRTLQRAWSQQDRINTMWGS